jgi:hypothetical protein
MTTTTETTERWRSCAEWHPCHGFPDNTTTDEHDSRGAAEAVCRGLNRMGLGGERIHFPVRTWVEPVVSCSHDRLDEDGICRVCGADRRGI